MSESEKPFTVSDRRHFTPEGRRKDGAEPDSPGEPPAPEPSAAAAASPEAAGEASEATSPASAGHVSSGTGPSGPAEGAPADFGQFLLSLATQASLLLAGQGLPEGTDPAQALEGARSIISILEMLREKTEGRRTARESELLEGLLFELRMAYVGKSRASGT
jgi:Domain of unknown function (DUF1844)